MFSILPQDGIDYSAGQTKSCKIPAGGMIEEVQIEVAGAPTVTGANNTAGNTKRGDELAIIDQIELKGSEALPLFTIPGSLLRWAHLFNYGTQLPTVSTLGDGTTANPSFTTVIPLPLWSTAALKPYDSAYDNTDEPNGLTLSVKWNDYTAINALATGWTTTPTCKVATLETEANDHPYLRKRLAWAQQTFSATGPQRMLLEPGNRYRRFLINTRNTGTGADAAGQFTSATLYIGQQQKQVMTEAQLFQLPYHRRGRDIPTSITKNTVELVKANYWWETCLDGYLTHVANTVRRAGNYIEFNLTTACTVTILYEILDDLRDSAVNGRRAARGKAA